LKRFLEAKPSWYFSEYEKAAAKLRPQNLILSKVDASAFPTLAKRFNIEGFPTLILFKNGEPAQKYEGERNAAGIVTVRSCKILNQFSSIKSNCIF